MAITCREIVDGKSTRKNAVLIKNCGKIKQLIIWRENNEIYGVLKVKLS